MTVYRRKTGRWTYDFIEAGMRRTRGGYTTKAEALAAQEFARADVRRGHIPVYSTMGDLVQAYLLDSARRKSAEWTYQLTKKLDKGFGHLATFDVRAVKPAHIQDVMGAMAAAGYSAAAMNEYRKIIRAVFAWGVRMEIVERNPANAVDKVPEPDRAPLIMETAHLKRLILAARPDLSSFLLAMSQTGARFRELARLRWSEVFTTAAEPFAVLTTRKKSGGNERKQPQPLTSVAVRAIESQRGRHAQWVWPASRGGSYNYNTAHKQLQTLTAEMELPAYGFHSVRHWAGYQAAAMGLNRKAVAAFLRHEDSGVTEIYLHAMRPEVWAIARRLEEEMGDDVAAEHEEARVRQ